MCPFNSRADWSKLKVNHPELFEKSLELEKIAKKHTTAKKPLEPLVRLKGKESMDLFQCDCF